MLNQRKQLPIKVNGNKQREVQVNELLTHPMEQGVSGSDRSRWRYRFLRVTRLPTMDRPDSGRILVENEATGKRSEFFALLFNVKFQGV